MTKKIFIVIVVMILLITSFAIYSYYKFNKIPVETGAVIAKLSQTELDPYNQMYELLEKGNIQMSNFEINPIKQKRIFEVKLKTPTNISKREFFDWLKQNNYDKIPKEKFLFIY